ncbi:MAG: hypothetical protein AAF580_02055 [Pseudomonadota bacterium]
MNEGQAQWAWYFQLQQVAAWTDAHKAWVDGHLNFRGRIDREKWVEQAAELVAKR